MNCPKCGNTCRIGARFCPKCGGSLPSSTCSQGHVLESGVTECPYCAKSSTSAQFTQPSGKGTVIEKDTSHQKATTFENSSVSSKPTEFTPSGSKGTRILDVKKKEIAGWIVGMKGLFEGCDFRLNKGKNVIGREANSNVVLKDDSVSSAHCNIRFDDEGKISIVDLNSSNGTYLVMHKGKSAADIKTVYLDEEPDIQLKEIDKEELWDGAEIKIGETIFRLKVF